MDRAAVAELIANGEEVKISGPNAEWINLELAVIDPENGERVTRADGAERWARLLPFAYRWRHQGRGLRGRRGRAGGRLAFRYSTAA